MSKSKIFEVLIIRKKKVVISHFKGFLFFQFLPSHDIVVVVILVVLLIVVVVNRDDTCSNSGGEPVRRARLWQVGVRAGRENVVPCSIHGYAMWKPRDTERRTDRHGPGESPPCGWWRRRFLVSRSGCPACS